MSVALAAIGAPHASACESHFGRRGFDSTRARAAAQAIAAAVRDLRAIVVPAPSEAAAPSATTVVQPAAPTDRTSKRALGRVLRHAILDLPPPTV